MVYESDFYTTRRPYRPTPSYSTYTSSKREIPWEKVPFVPRPSLVPDPITAYGKRKPEKKATGDDRPKITSASERAKIKPKVLIGDPAPYKSPRDLTREKIFNEILRPNKESMDTVLPRLHRLAAEPSLPYKQRLYALNSDFIY